LRCFALGLGLLLFLLQVGHYGFYEFFCAFYAAYDCLQVEPWLRGVAVGDAVDAVLAGEDERVGEQVERYGKTAAVVAHHEFIFFEVVAAFFVDGHGSSLVECWV
jgi:hypothetical protein